jgi:PAS domain S-box-containing protein
MWQQLAEGQTWRGEICNRRRDGQTYWVEATIVPVAAEDGMPCHYVSIRTDITAVKLAQQRACDAEQRFRRGQEFAHLGTWDLDLHTQLATWSDLVAPMLGYATAPAQPSQALMLAAIHPADRQAFSAALQRCVDQAGSFELEHRCLWPDGSSRWMLQRGNVTRAENGDARHLVAVMQDITLRKRLELDLSLFSRLVEATQQGVVVVDARSGRLSWANSAAAAILGFERERLLGQDTLRRVPREARATLLRAARRCAHGERCSVSFTFDMPDGRPAQLHHALIGIADAHGKLSHYISVFDDQTPQLQQRLALEQALAEAQHANRAKAEFMSRMSHELRTPLNAILGFSQVLLMRRDLAAQQADGVQEILRAGQHLLALINEVLDLSQIDLGRLSVSPEPVDCAVVMQQALTLVAAMAHERGITITQRAAPGLAVMADRVRLKQSLINLASNAVKYNRPGGRVDVCASLIREGRVRIEVADTGPGIAEADLPRLFQPFSRLEAVRDSVKGVGIGLAITQRLIRLMGGEVGVASRPGEGTRFWIELAAAAPMALARPEADAPAAPASGLASNTRRVLYIEDNLANFKLVRSMLGMLPGVQVIGAATAAQGLAEAAQAKPDLVLLDINLPDLSGLELLPMLRRLPGLAATPIIAVSANAMPTDIARGQEAGFDDYVTKPFEMHLLLGSVKSHLPRDESGPAGSSSFHV